MYEKCYEYNIELHDVFMDFNQTFDSINRSTVIKVLKEMRIPGKSVSLFNMVTQHTKAKIKLNNEYTEQIEVKNGIKQGDPLSTILFYTVMESLMKTLEIRGNITTRLKQVCVYADYVVVLTRTKQTNKYIPDAKAGGREVWISNKSKQNKIHEAFKNTKLWERH